MEHLVNQENVVESMDGCYNNCKDGCSDGCYGGCSDGCKGTSSNDIIRI